MAQQLAGGPAPAPVVEPMKPWRVRLVYGVVGAIVLGHLDDIARQQEHWPFSNYPMWARPAKDWHIKNVVPVGLTVAQSPGEVELTDAAYLARRPELIQLPALDFTTDSNGLETGWQDGRSASQHARLGGLVTSGFSESVPGTWAQRFPDPVIAFASGWMSIRQRAKAGGIELPLVISDHADWNELTQTVRDVNPRELWVTHGRDDALARWAELEGRKARPLHLVGYEDEAGE